MKTVNGWCLLDDELDDGYEKFSHVKDSWQFGLAHKGMAWCDKFDTCVDLGSAYGAISKILAKNFKEVHAVEMYPPFINCAKINTRMHDNITYHNCIIADFNGKKEVQSALYGGRSHSVPIPSQLEYRQEKKPIVPVRKFDVFIEDNSIKDIDLIKIDIENSEHFFVEYGMNTLKKNKPVLIIETHAKYVPKQYKTYVKDTLLDLDFCLVEKTRNDFIYVHKNKLDVKMKRTLYEW